MLQSQTTQKNETPYVQYTSSASLTVFYILNTRSEHATSKSGSNSNEYTNSSPVF